MLAGGNNLIESKLITWNKEKQVEFPFLVLFWHRSPYSCEDNLWPCELPVAIASLDADRFLSNWVEDAHLTPFSSFLSPLSVSCFCGIVPFNQSQRKKTTTLWVFQGYPKQGLVWRAEVGWDIGCAKQHFHGGMSDWRSLLTVLGSNVPTGKRQILVQGCH